MHSAMEYDHRRLSKWQLFLALSRTPHGLLDLAMPFAAALIWLGTLPPLHTILLGALTAFAGYTAVYALNDVVDYRVDRQEMLQSRVQDSSIDLDALYVRHPLAQGLLSFKDGLLWAAGWAAVALLGAYTLNPACAAIFLLGAVLETIYCLMLRVSYLRVLVSGVVKTLGAMAAVYAIDPTPSPFFLVVLFMWIFFWEIGGQNVPNDWTDVEEDRQLRAETIPVRFGVHRASSIILYSLITAVFLSAALMLFTPAKLGGLYLAGVLGAGIYFLVIPASYLYKDKGRQQASALFNRSSHYPLSVFCVVLISLIF